MALANNLDMVLLIGNVCEAFTVSQIPVYTIGYQVLWWWV
jgi:hypothetical protein